MYEPKHQPVKPFNETEQNIETTIDEMYSKFVNEYYVDGDYVCEFSDYITDCQYEGKIRIKNSSYFIERLIILQEMYLKSVENNF